MAGVSNRLTESKFALGAENPHSATLRLGIRATCESGEIFWARKAINEDSVRVRATLGKEPA